MAEEKAIIYLDFGGKLTSDTFDKDVFIRIANLHKKNPLVQVNDGVYKGTYDYALGTNLFFEANKENPKQNDIFIKRSQIQYENTYTTAKIIDLQPVKVPPRKVQVSSDKKLEFNLNWDYRRLLEKFSDGTLKLQDILKDGRKLDETDESEDGEEDEKMISLEENDNQTNGKIDENISDALEDEGGCSMVEATNVPMDILEDYQKLRQLAFRPVKMPAKQEKLQECDPKYRGAYEYHNLERQILQPCDYFRTEPVDDINEETLSNCVDIDRCILYGLIDKSVVNRKILTKEEKQTLLSLDNFDNLSLAGRYYVLKNHVDDLEDYLKNRTEDELSSRDAYGRTPVETLEVYRRLSEAVKKRIEEIKYSTLDDHKDNSKERKVDCIEND